MFSQQQPGRAVLQSASLNFGCAWLSGHGVVAKITSVVFNRNLVFDGNLRRRTCIVHDPVCLSDKAARPTCRSLPFTSGSSLTINPDHGSADHLKEWYESVEFQRHHLQSITSQQTYINTPTKLLSQIKDENLGHGDKSDYFNVQATVLFFKKDNALYKI
ncbi:replication protein A 70 kDa DNA-binding subunit-like isoform X2 [Corticium candelabrum]|uniref:replication protein A 70 kDa DNA-binding subunit-like isoform X1 n=1 Tax=Corticium candelabrum TaxID=121492 RepID=UPI002E33A753|nr:replication protein A 70 kDa DNA-binding subunit-like isoform X1 [Corticium candelabrum]XP_062507949.1 replication protein A 70 kDa DNA-binding subunit-like isoform X2 [Corticium candelabrum]